MRAHLQELSLFAFVIFLASLCIFVYLDDNEVTESELTSKGFTTLGTGPVNGGQNLSKQIAKSKKQGKINNRKNRVRNPNKAGEGSVNPIMSARGRTLDNIVSNSEDEAVDFLVGLDIDEDIVSDATVAMFEVSEDNVTSELIWDVEEDPERAQREFRDNVLDDLHDAGISTEEMDMVLKTMLSDLEYEDFGEGLGIEGKSIVAVEDESTMEMPTPMDESNTPVDIMEDIIEAMSMEDEGYPNGGKSFIEDNEFEPLSTEDIEAIIYDFQNYDMSIEEIEGIQETTSKE